MSTPEEHLYSAGERHILRELREIRALIEQEDAQMDAAGEALQNEIEKLDTDVVADNEAVVKGGEAVASAGTKFAELKALIEKQATGALTDEEAQKLTSLAGEVDTHLGEATTQLTEHVKQLGEEAAAA